MENPLPSLQHLNRTLIGSVLFIDIVDYSKRTVPDQIAMKEVFIGMLVEAVENVAPNERIMVDTGDGAGIAFLGDPEDALFAALSLRDAVDAGKATIGEPGFVRMGINLGPLKVVRDINGHTNMIGDGVNDAQRVMSFAEPGQVMVSHSYFDIISRFSRDYSKLFLYEGKRQDKHVREHEVYRFGPTEGSEVLTEKLRDRSRARQFSDTIGPGHAAQAPVPEAPIPLKPNPPAAPAKMSGSRIGLIATAIGAVAIAGAVWSWTSKPAPKQEAASEPVLTAAASTPENPAASAVATAPEASKSTPVDKAPAGKVEKPAASASSSALASSPASAHSTASASSTSASASVPLTPAMSASATASAPLDGTDKTASASSAQKPGSVKLAIHPWGEIYVDGKKRGISPPLKALSIEPGVHKVEIRNSSFAPHKESVDVKSGGEVTVHYSF